MPKIAALNIFALTAFHAYASVRLFYILAIGKSTNWFLFGVANCCDIPMHEIQSSTASMASLLAAIAYCGRWLVPGLLHLRPRAWWSSVALCSFVILGHWAMMGGKVDSVKVIHLQFIAFCLFPVSLLLLSAPFYFGPEKVDKTNKGKHAMEKTNW